MLLLKLLSQAWPTYENVTEAIDKGLSVNPQGNYFQKL